MRFIQGKSLSYLVLQAEEQRERQPTIEKIAQYLLHCPLLTSLFNLHGDSILGIFGSEGGGGGLSFTGPQHINFKIPIKI